ncbi:13084_t:CDS:1, partial [Racocetra persica]
YYNQINEVPNDNSYKDDDIEDNLDKKRNNNDDNLGKRSNNDDCQGE